MKRILALVLVIAMLCTGFAFALTLSDVKDQKWAEVEFNGGKAVSYEDSGCILFEKDGQLSWLAKKYNLPTGMTTDEEGNLYISETGRGRIIRMTPEGKSTVFAKNLTEPTGLCWADGKLYVAETGKNRVLSVEKGKTTVLAGQAKFIESGQYEGGFVNGDVKIAEFNHPQGVAVDAEGVVYVADTGNHAVRYIKDGNVYPFITNSDLEGYPVKPCNAWFDEEGFLYVNDMFTDTLIKFSTKLIKFSDVAETEWFAAKVQEAQTCGIVEGLEGNKFNAAGKVTRAQFVTFLSRVALFKNSNLVINGEKTFNDIDHGAWYAKAASWAADNGVTTGSSTNGVVTFSGSSFITRQDLVTMLYRYAQSNGIDVSVGKDTNILDFEDARSVASYAVEAMQWAVGAGIVNGTPVKGGLALNPEGNTTRAEAVVMLMRFIAL